VARIRLAALVLGAALLSPWHAFAQVDSREGIALQNQILELRRDLQDLRNRDAGGDSGSVLTGRRHPDSGGGANGDLVASLLDRVQSLEDQVRQLRGRVEEIDNRTRLGMADLNKQLGDLNFRLGSGAGAAPPPASPGLTPPPLARSGAAPPVAAPAPGPAPGPVPRTPELGLQEGNAALARRDYAAAEAAAREVLAGNRVSPRAYDAQYLLAEALDGKRDYAQAAIAYDDAYNRAKTGAHAPESLIGLARSLNAINEKRSACEIVAKLAHEFPNLAPGLRDEARGVQQRAGCG
jgi:TolA-binding protein